jgi:hypothetical protein
MDLYRVLLVTLERIHTICPSAGLEQKIRLNNFVLAPLSEEEINFLGPAILGAKIKSQKHGPMDPKPEDLKPDMLIIHEQFLLGSSRDLLVKQAEIFKAFKGIVACETVLCQHDFIRQLLHRCQQTNLSCQTFRGIVHLYSKPIPYMDKEAGEMKMLLPADYRKWYIVQLRKSHNVLFLQIA